MSPALPRLTAEAATAAGWRLVKTPTGRTRWVDPAGRRYVPTTEAFAVFAILPATAGLPPVYLRRVVAAPRLFTLQRRAAQAVLQ